MLCNCINWARACDIAKPMTNHHPNCPRVDESLIDVWRVQTPGDKGGLIVDSEEVARSAASEDPDAPLEITAQKMHREIFDRLPEFGGW